MAERKYRDPVHNIIALDSDQEADRLLIALIDTAEFQRLRRIKQLGLALYTYQGAEHSRFTHSLGVMHVVTRVLARLAHSSAIPAEYVLIARVAALLHDIGHGPFSHVIEKATTVHHEAWTAQILLDPQTEVHQVLTDYDPALPQKLVDVYQHKFSPDYVSQLVSSPLDCDRFDYLLRDSLMTGARYGNYDLEWIIHALKLHPDQQRIYVSAKGLYAVEQYLQARFYMFRQVYFHHSLRAAENMLLSILKRAVYLLTANRLQFSLPDSSLTKLLSVQPMTTPGFLSLDDHDIMFHIKQWVHESDNILKDLCCRFINRRLFKSVDISKSDWGQSERFKQAQQFIEAAGFEEAYYMLKDSAQDIPYFGPYTPNVQEPKACIFLEVKHRTEIELREITEVSDVIRSMKRLQIDRLYFPKEVSVQLYQLFNQ